MRVLIVEDDADIRDLAADFLTEAGYQVLRASNGSEAARLLIRAAEVGALLTDVMLSGWLDGADLVELARLQNRQMPIVIMSGFSAGLLSRLGGMEPPVSFLPKPFSSQQLVATLEAAIKGCGTPTGAVTGS